MKYKFREVKLSANNKLRLHQINSIILEYQNAGYKMTLRQLYYQLVSRDVIPNQQKEYSKLSTLLKEGRMGGIVDWDAIEDRLRNPETPSSWDTPQEIMDTVIRQYQKPRMEGQENYLEVWVEKDALSGVLSRVTEKYHVPILVNRGYSSASAMHEAYTRFRGAWEKDQKIKILYLGDHDPSGIDMIRDIEDRIIEFFWGLLQADKIEDGAKEILYTDHNLDFEVIPIALTRAQINQYNPPPNPAKMTDPRSGEYVKINGKVSWEVDALRPDVLHKILEDTILNHIDSDMYEEVLDAEKADKKKLKDLSEKL